MQVKRVEQHELGNRIAEVSVRLLEQQVIAEFVLVAEEGEVVLVTALALELARVGVEHARLAQVVECEIGIGQFFFEFGIVCDRLDHALA